MPSPWSPGAARRRPRPQSRRRRPEKDLLAERLEPRTLLDGQAGTVVIGEFLASNSGGLRDQDGDASDWIELYNAGGEPVDLGGWSLTDDADDLDRWRFPSVTLDTGEFLVVFASNKDRATAGSELHTNFAISANGEFLGLVRPDGTIADAFSPEFPAQRANVSYGHVIDATPLVAAGASAQVAIPTDDSLGRSWTEPGFVPDARWTTGPTGVGFGVTQPGFFVHYYEANRTVDDLTVAYDVIARPDLQRRTASEAADTINYFNTGSSAHFGGDRPFPTQTLNEDVEDFVIDARGLVNIPTAGTWTFGVNSDDGFELVLERSGQSPIAIAFPDLRGPDDTIQAVDIPEAGAWGARLVYYERGGGSGVELFAAPGVHGAFDDAMRLVGDTSGGGLAVFHAGDTGGGPILATDVGPDMLGVSPSAFVRIPFEVADPTLFETLLLRMRYDDGFVAYLNGVEVARRNAPGLILGSSSATASRDGFEILDPETIGLNEFLDLLQPGTNVLAIQGLNSSPGDADFLLLPELLGVIVRDDARYFATPTPGDLNATPYLGLVSDVTASVEHGFFDAPFTVELAAATPGALIRYTLDGSFPTEANGLDYSGPLTIDRTTTLRAVAVLLGYLPAPPENLTYLFLDDVIAQSLDGSPPPGWPSTWGNNVVDYGMDPDIVNDPRFGGTALLDALKAIPSFSVTTDLANLFDPATGIYANAFGQGRDWERPAAVELINPDGSPGFDINAGLRIRGGFSRSGDNPKHAFRLFFRGDYEGDLNFPLFGAEGADTFEKVDLRTAQNYSWSFQGDARYNFLRDIFSRDTQRDMGQPYTRGRYYHLYLDGQYWGLYQTQERSEAAFAESYFGGEEDNYDVVKVEAGPYVIQATDGTLDAWQRLWEAGNAGFSSDADYLRVQGKNPDGTDNPDYEALLDVDNLIDYMLVILYGGNLDAPISAFLGNGAPNNFYAVRDRTARQGFRFFAHDSEHTLLNLFEDRTGPFPAGEQFEHFNPQWLHQQLMANAEYRLRFADHVRRHFFDDGALTPDKARERFLARVAEVGPAILGESARWGDAKVDIPFTLDNWQASVDDVLNNFIPGRTAVVLDQLRAIGLYPLVEAPSFLVDGQPNGGGRVPGGSELRLLAPSGLVYYTLDGTDPRLHGGSVNPTAIAYDPGVTTTSLVAPGSVWSFLDDGSDPGTSWRGAGFDDSSWASGPAELGYGDGDEATTVGSGPDAGNRFITTYFRRTFDAGTLAGLVGLTLRLRRDDGAVVYLNGVEVARSNMPSGPITPGTLASGTVGGEDESAFLDFFIDPAALLPGANVLAVEVHQSDPTSSDVSFDLELLALASTAPAIVLDATANFIARTFEGGVWSALDSAAFLVGDPAGAANLAVTEIEYNPHAPDPSSGELDVDKEDYEFIELRNIGPREIDLSGVRFTTGITFDFTGGAVTTLAPGGYVVLVKNPDAFRSRFGDFATIAGTYSGNLSNGGERITLVADDDAVIRDFTYDDDAPWPLSPDGGGTSLVVVDPAGDLNDPADWRASVEHGGSPGFAGNTPPTISGPTDAGIDEDATGSVSFVVLDAEPATDPLLVTVASSDPDLLPATGLVLSGSGADRLLTVTPSPDRHGSATITVTVDDGAGGLASASFVLTVRPVNDLPTAVDRTFATAEDATLVVDGPGLLADADDRDGDALAADVADLPDHGTVIVRPDGSFTYTPAPDFHGEDSFTYVIKDGQADSAATTVRITIASVPDAPELPPIADRAATEGEALAFTITAHDADGPSDRLTYTLGPGSPPTARIDPGTGDFNWVPSEADGPGVFPITVHVADASSPALTASRTFTITVAEANRGPVLDPIADATVAEGSTITIAAHATDPDGQAHRPTYSLGPDAPAGMTIDPATGLIAWTPADSRIESFTVTVRASDDGSPSLADSRVFSVQVFNVAPTVAAGLDAVTVQGAPLTREGSFTDPGIEAWTATVDYGDGEGRQPLALNPDKTFRLEHSYASAGVFVVTVAVTDRDGAIGTSSFEVQAREVTGPQVVSFQSIASPRGFTSLVVGFSKPLVPSLAGQLPAYRLVTAGRDRRFGTRDDVTIRLRSASYNPATGLVTLTPRGPLSRRRPYQLTALSNLLTDPAGNSLDGDGDGLPGGDAVIRFGSAARPAVSARAVDILSASRELTVVKPRHRG